MTELYYCPDCNRFFDDDDPDANGVELGEKHLCTLHMMEWEPIHCCPNCLDESEQQSRREWINLCVEVDNDYEYYSFEHTKNEMDENEY